MLSSLVRSIPVVVLDVIDDFEVWFTFLFKLFKQSEKNFAYNYTTLNKINSFTLIEKIVILTWKH